MELFAEILAIYMTFRIAARLMLGGFPVDDGVILLFLLLFLKII